VAVSDWALHHGLRIVVVVRHENGDEREYDLVRSRPTERE
jgi:hypothetical protein